MKTNNFTFPTGAIVLLILAAIAQGEATASTLTRENHITKGREAAGNSNGSTFLGLYSAPGGELNPAVPVRDRDDRYAAIGPRTNGLVGWWKLDETAGTVASDSSGNGHNGTLLNGPTWTTGQMRGALSFDGTNDQVTCVDSPALRISGDLTIALWMKKSAESKQAAFVLGKANTKVRNYVIWVEAGSDGRLLFQQLNSAGQGINLWTSSKLAVGTWYHVAAVVQSSNVSLYLNGKFDGSKTRSIPSPTTTDPLAFGYGGWNEHYPGVLDDVRIYNRALTADEIAKLHSEAFPDRRRADSNLELPLRSHLAKAQARRIAWSHSRRDSF